LIFAKTKIAQHSQFVNECKKKRRGKYPLLLG